jgi:sporulation protein YqfC
MLGKRVQAKGLSIQMRKIRNRNRRAQDQPDAAPEKKSRLPEVFDIPGSAINGIAHIELAGNREAIVDGCQGVLEYDENVIKLTTGKMVIKFMGRGLQIKVLTHDSAVVSGFITNIEFIT